MGRSTGRTSDRRAEKLDRPPGAFVWHSKDMRESPAWQVMSGRARKMLDRIELEHLRHGGVENGRLKVTFDDFVRAGVRRQDIPRTEAELIALGFIERRFEGRKAWGNAKGQPAEFRLCHLCVRSADDIEPPKNAWAQFETLEEARQAVTEALAAEKAFRKPARLSSENIDSRAETAPEKGSTFVLGAGLQKCRNGTGASAETAPGKNFSEAAA